MSSPRPFRNRPRLILTLLGTLLVVLGWSTAASADWTTINTNNAQIDNTWGDPIYTDACTNASRPADEIKNAWLKFDGTSVYLRIETCDPNQVLSDNTTSKKMRAVGAIDCNGNGTFEDGDTQNPPNGDRLIIYYNNPDDTVWVHSGSGAQVIQADSAAQKTYSEEIGANVEWKADLSNLYPGCRSSLAAKQLAWATVEITCTGSICTSSETIDISTATTTLFNPLDFGDLTNPNPPDCTTAGYPTRLPCSGARHGIVAGSAILGSQIDPNEGDLQDVAAVADDNSNTGSVDDEDGVVPTTAFAWSTLNGGSLLVTTTGASGYLSCWVDWNNDKDVVDAGEKVISDLAVSAGATTVPFAVPSNPSGLYYARCRVSPGTGTGPGGPIYGGEVEDYRWLPQTATLKLGISGGSNAQLSWNEVNADDRYDVFRSSTPYFVPSGGPLGNDVVDSPYSDAGVVGTPPDVYFYKLVKVRSADGATYSSVASNEVGLFEYALAAGTP